MKTWTREEDKAKLPDGVWQDEPDKAVWIDEKTGLDCMIVRNRIGALCGYVGVEPDSPLHGCFYDCIRVEVHGGLTYAAACQEGEDESDGLCHVPEPGRPTDVWWFGFDCGHGCDYIPGMEVALNKLDPERSARKSAVNELLTAVPAAEEIDPLWGEKYRDFNYVKEQVEMLAYQIKRGPKVEHDHFWEGESWQESKIMLPSYPDPTCKGQ